MVLGHAGDGNLHVIGQRAASTADVDAIQTAIYKAVAAVGGSISAEHGVGRAKLGYLGYNRSPAEIELMRLIKRARDPRNLLNPGKVVTWAPLTGLKTASSPEQGCAMIPR